MAGDEQTTIHRIKPHLFKEPPTDGSPWIADWRSYDVPETVSRYVRGAALAGACAVTLSMFGGPKMILAAEAAAREHNIRVLWWFGPSIADIPESGRAYLRQCVADARALI